MTSSIKNGAIAVFFLSLSTWSQVEAANRLCETERGKIMDYAAQLRSETNANDPPVGLDKSQTKWKNCVVNELKNAEKKSDCDAYVAKYHAGLPVVADKYASIYRINLGKFCPAVEKELAAPDISGQ